MVFQTTTRLNAPLFLLLVFATWNGQAQSLRNRLSLGLETSMNAPGAGDPASVSLAAEPKIWIVNKFHVGVKCDVAIGSFGESDNIYTEPRLGSVASLVLKGYLEQRFGYARVFAGLGVGRFFGNEFYSRSMPFGFPVSQNYDTLRLSPAWGREWTIGAKGDNLYFSLTFKKVKDSDQRIKMPSHFSTTVGIEFGDGKYLTSFRRKEDYTLPPLMIEIGQQLAVPIGNPVGAVSRAPYIELKVGFKQRFSIGARLVDFQRKGYGTDTKGYSLQELLLITDASYYLRSTRINSMKLVHSHTLFLDYYFPRKSGWIYAGIGGGWYRFDGLRTLEFDTGPDPVRTVTGIPASDKPGLLLRVGHKVGFFRAGLDLNLTGPGVPEFVSLHLGLEPGLFFYREKD